LLINRVFTITECSGNNLTITRRTRKDLSILETAQIAHLNRDINW